MQQAQPLAGIVDDVHILLATDADWIVDEVTAALGGPDTSFTVCNEGRVVCDVVKDREPDLVITDMQIGSMGGIAVTMALRLDESGGLLPHCNILLLLDRPVDVHLARRSDADGWLVKPLDAMRLKRAALAVASGEPYPDGVVSVPAPDDQPDTECGDDPKANVEASAEEEPATAG